MDLDRNPFWGIERSHTTDDIARMHNIKFKTTNRDETAQEYTVSKDDGEHGANQMVRGGHADVLHDRRGAMRHRRAFTLRVLPQMSLWTSPSSLGGSHGAG